jgi:hypothetical protein
MGGDTLKVRAPLRRDRRAALAAVTTIRWCRQAGVPGRRRARLRCCRRIRFPCGRDAGRRERAGARSAKGPRRMRPRRAATRDPAGRRHRGYRGGVRTAPVAVRRFGKRAQCPIQVRGTAEPDGCGTRCLMRRRKRKTSYDSGPAGRYRRMAHRPAQALTPITKTNPIFSAESVWPIGKAST